MEMKCTKCILRYHFDKNTHFFELILCKKHDGRFDMYYLEGDKNENATNYNTACGTD